MIKIFTDPYEFCRSMGIEDPERKSFTRLRRELAEICKNLPRKTSTASDSAIATLKEATVLGKRKPRESALAYCGCFEVSKNRLTEDGLFIQTRGIADPSANIILAKKPVGTPMPSDLVLLMLVSDDIIETDFFSFFFQLVQCDLRSSLYGVKTKKGILFFRRPPQGDRQVPAYAQAVTKIIQRRAARNLGVNCSGSTAMYDNVYLGVRGTTPEAAAEALQESCDYYEVVCKFPPRPVGKGGALGIDLNTEEKTFGVTEAFANKTRETANMLLDRATFRGSGLDILSLAGLSMWTLMCYLLPLSILCPLAKYVSKLASDTTRSKKGWRDTYQVQGPALDIIKRALTLASQRPMRRAVQAPEHWIPLATDAQPQGAAWLSSQSAFWYNPRGNNRQIYRIELAIALWAYIHHILTGTQPATYALMEDNSAATISVRKRYARSHELAHLVTYATLLGEQRHSMLLPFQTPTDLQPADPLSRTLEPSPTSPVPPHSIPSSVRDTMERESRPLPHILLSTMIDSRF